MSLLCNPFISFPATGNITVVQSTSTNISNAANFTATLNGVQAGNALILVIAHGQSGSNAVPTIGTAMNEVLDVTSANIARTSENSFPGLVRIWHEFGVTAGNKAVQATFTTENYGMMTLMEVSGISQLDSTFNAGFGTSTTTSVGPTSVPGGAPALVVGGWLQMSSSATGTGVLGTPTGFTATAVKNTGVMAHTAHKIQSSPSAETLNWTTNKTDQWTTAVAIYR